MRRVLFGWLFCAVVMLPGAAVATVYTLPSEGDLVGETTDVVATHDDTLVDLARRYGLGYEEVVNANPGVDPWLPGEGTRVRLPLQRILPETPREGIVVNLPEHRLYYYPPVKPGETRTVVTYPVSVGKMDWSSPLGLTKIQTKIKDPSWTPPESVRREHAERGDILPKVIPPGPDNPLGLYAMRLAIPGGSYLIHGTNHPAGVGMQVTHGCMRLYPEHIEELFRMVAVDTPVRLVNQPQKVGQSEGRLYVEVHPAMETTSSEIVRPDRTTLARLVANTARAYENTGPIQWESVETAFGERRGVPVTVAQRP